MEKQAKSRLLQITQVPLQTKVRLVVHPLLPWLGYSPDGVVFTKGAPTVLDVKNPVHGRTNKAAKLVEERKLPYVKKDGENIVLNSRHSYCSQVQLEMFLLNMNLACFVMYSEVESLVFTVQQCDEHTDRLIRRLQFVYFRHLLPGPVESV